MRSVVEYLDAPNEDRFVDAEDALQDECGYGGRIDERDTYRFTYLTPDGQHRWQIVLHEEEIRAISDGLQIEAAGERFEVVRTRHRTPSGEPLLVWGEYGDDALIIASHDDLAAALEQLRLATADRPRMLRLWSVTDDQIVAAAWRDECALYVIESLDGYATSTGDPKRTDVFTATDHDGRPLAVPGADCVPWAPAARALIRFAAHGDLGPEIRTEGRIPSSLLMFGEVDRETVLAVRSVPTRDPRATSLARLAAPIPAPVHESTEMTVPVEVMRVEDFEAWGERLVRRLVLRELIELARDAAHGEIRYRLTGLLQAHGLEAEDSIDTAEWLAAELRALPGVTSLFATGGDLQLALRRSRMGFEEPR